MLRRHYRSHGYMSAATGVLRGRHPAPLPACSHWTTTTLAYSTIDSPKKMNKTYPPDVTSRTYLGAHRQRAFKAILCSIKLPITIIQNPEPNLYVRVHVSLRMLLASKAKERIRHALVHVPRRVCHHCTQGILRYRMCREPRTQPSQQHRVGGLVK